MGAMTDQYKKINELLDEAEELIVETGLYDSQTARALFIGIRPPALDNVVGNIADLQRQPLMPPGFEQGATVGANPAPTVQPGAPVEVLGKTSRQKMEDAGVTLPETPATSDEAIETMSQSTTMTPTVVDGSADAATAEAPQSTDASLDSMTKTDLQAYAEENGISGVDQNNMTKDEMLAAIRGQ